ncbi:hypothetical protein ACLB1N_35970 [Escherichia coli]
MQPSAVIHRQSEIYRRQEQRAVPHWGAAGAVSLTRSARRRPAPAHVLMPGKSPCHDIPVPVQERQRCKTWTARLWVYAPLMTVRRSHTCPLRSGSRNNRTGKVSSTTSPCGYSGVLQADAYGGYWVLYESEK